MAIFANTYLTYSAKGQREQLSDMIYMISPEETPFLNNLKRGSTDGTYYEWQSDSLAAAAANDVVEGDEISPAAATPTVRLGNYAQISRKDAIVSGTLERVSKAGRKGEMAYQMSKRAAELKLDMEYVACQNQAARAGNSTTSRRTAGFECFIRTNDNRGVGGADSTLSGSTEGYPNAAPTDGTPRTFTETILKTALQTLWTNGGKPKLIFLGPAQKVVFSGFAGIAQHRRESGDSPVTVIGSAEVYVSDFGALTAVPCRNQRNRSALLVDPEYAEIVFLRPFFTKDLAVTGDATKKALLVEWGTRFGAEAAHGVIADLS